jgi:hypothetical protein
MEASKVARTHESCLSARKWSRDKLTHLVCVVRTVAGPEMILQRHPTRSIGSLGFQYFAPIFSTIPVIRACDLGAKSAGMPAAAAIDGQHQLAHAAASAQSAASMRVLIGSRI